jgi:hypothetical protein
VPPQAFLGFLRFFASADRFLAAAFEAFVAISLRRSGDSLLARSLPPWRPNSDSTL